MLTDESSNHNQRCFPIRSFITLEENFGKWRPCLELFFGGGGQKFHWGAAALEPPLHSIHNVVDCGVLMAMWEEQCTKLDTAINS